MSNTSSGRMLVSIPDIARIAEVGRSAVGNWRKRHPDFPSPAVETPSGAMFDLAAVEKWLVENGKITKRVPASHRLWVLVDSIRGLWEPREFFSFLVSLLVYFEAIERHPDLSPDRMSLTEAANASELREELELSFQELEEQLPELEGLLLPGIQSVDQGLATNCGSLMDLLRDWDNSTTRRFEVFEEATQRLLRADRMGPNYSTPIGIRSLVAALAEFNGGKVLDLAVGDGGLLLETAVADTKSRTPLTLVGVARNASIARIARARLYLYGLDNAASEIVVGNPLEEFDASAADADVVVVDPPYGQRDWGTAEVYLSDRWRFGNLGPQSADLAWVQLAAMALKPGGRAFVLLPPGALSRGHAERMVRKNLIESGVVEGIVLLPSALRNDTAIPLALWLLRSDQQTPAPEVLLVDASELGVRGRGTTRFDEDAVNQVVQVVSSWRTHGVVPATSSVSAVAVPVADIADGDLHPRRYQARSPIDRTELNRQVVALREQLGLPLADPDAAMVGQTVLAKLGDLVRVVRGVPISVTDDPNGWPVLGAREIIGSAQRFVDGSPARAQTVLSGDVVLVMDARGGRCVVTEKQSGWALAPECAALRIVAPERVTPQWLYLWTCSSDYQDQFKRHGAGSVMPRLHGSSLREFTIPVPPVEVQRVAARRMGTVADAIIEAKSRLHQLEELMRAETDLLVEAAEDPDE